MSQSTLSAVDCNATVIDLARTLLTTRDLSLCPILADAIEEMGCTDTDTDTLNGLRAEAVFGRKPYASTLGRILRDILGITVVRLSDADARSHRLKARTVSADSAVEDVTDRAIFHGRAWLIRDGGTVANAYRYPAFTEGVLTAAIYDATTNTVRVKMWATELPANKVTHRGVAASFGFGDLADARVGTERKDAAREALYAELG